MVSKNSKALVEAETHLTEAFDWGPYLSSISRLEAHVMTDESSEGGGKPF